jgi:hypothetical protein
VRPRWTTSPGPNGRRLTDLCAWGVAQRARTTALPPARANASEGRPIAFGRRAV